MKYTRLARFARTIGHLDSSQLWWRGRYAVRRRLRPSRVAMPPGFERDDLESSLAGGDLPEVPVGHRTGPEGPQAVDELARGEFRFLHHSELLGCPKTNWVLGRQTEHRLWAVTLHYHAWAYALAEVIHSGGALRAKAAELFRGFLGDWMDRCGLEAPGARHLAWNAYAVSSRIVWWIRCYRLLEHAWFRDQRPFERNFLQSLWRQAAYLYDHLEWDVLANHLMRDTVGLAWAARFFHNPQSQAWMQRATSVAVDQLDAQVLPDGGHFERSPMYHLHVMEDLLSLGMLLDDEAARNRVRAAWSRMAEYLAWVRHPDGEIPLLNDSTRSGALPAQRMLAHGSSFGLEIDASPRVGGRWFSDTGLAVWHGKPWSLFFDLGPIGPPCQPGHAHADSLTIECSVNGQRLFVDPGSYAYDHDERRRYDRSTAAHNTVCVDDTDSSEMWHIFRVGRRARTLRVSAEADNRSLQAAASHNGYRHLHGSPMHTRRIRVQDGDALTIVDRIDGEGDHRLESGYLLASGWLVHSRGSGWDLHGAGQHVRVTVDSRADLQLDVQRRVLHPEFGLEVETNRLAWRCAGALPVEVTTTVELVHA